MTRPLTIITKKRESLWKRLQFPYFFFIAFAVEGWALMWGNNNDVIITHRKKNKLLIVTDACSAWSPCRCHRLKCFSYQLCYNSSGFLQTGAFTEFWIFVCKFFFSLLICFFFSQMTTISPELFWTFFLSFVLLIFHQLPLHQGMRSAMKTNGEFSIT